MESFNDYKNKPTWIVATSIQKNEELFSYWRKKVEELYRRELVKELKLQIEGIDNPLTERATLYSELLSYSLELVNWDEIVDMLKEEEK